MGKNVGAVHRHFCYHKNMLEFLVEMLGRAYFFAAGTAVWWVPVLLGYIFFRTWTAYTFAYFQSQQEHTLLEMRIPKETYKSPLAMEIVLEALYSPVGESTWYDRYILGKRRAWSSLEIVSIEGKVRFFVWARTDMRESIESHIYSQYPFVEITEAADYTQRVPYGKEESEWALFGSEFTLTKPDPYPIKTYVDYGLDKETKEEFRIDPLASTLETLAGLRKDEQIWIQIIVRATKKDKRATGNKLLGKFKPYDWKKEGENLAQEIRGKAQEEERRPTRDEEDVIKAIRRNVSKFGFDCGIRVLYLAKGDAFRGPMIGGLMGSFAQFSSEELNGLRPSMLTNFKYPWSDLTGRKMKWLKAEFFNAYVRRGYFHPPHKREPFILNTEELATIYHFPGRVAETPSLERIESKKGGPPTNLPL